MTLAELEDELPWGLHDAHLESLGIDWPNARLSLEMRLPMSESQDLDQRARVTISGLVYCTIEAPTLDPSRGYEPAPEAGLWIEPVQLSHDEAARNGLPATPEGAFAHQFFVRDWNRSIYVCGRDAALVWLEPEPVAARSNTRARFPGDEVPDAVPGGS